LGRMYWRRKPPGGWICGRTFWPDCRSSCVKQRWRARRQRGRRATFIANSSEPIMRDS
jgi:hypothetical protein